MALLTIEVQYDRARVSCFARKSQAEFLVGPVGRYKVV